MTQAPLLGIGMGFRQCPGGFVVTNVHAGGPADRAGMLSDDVICVCMHNGENLALKAGACLNEMLANNTDPIIRFGIRRGQSPNIISVVVVRTLLSVSSDGQNETDIASPYLSQPTCQFERETSKAVSGVAPGSSGRAGTYSSPGTSRGMRGYTSVATDGNSLYDSEKSDNYTSAGGNYSSQRGSISDSSREGYSSDDARSQPSPHTYVGRHIPSDDGDSRDPSPHRRPVSLTSRHIVQGASTAMRASHELFRQSARPRSVHQTSVKQDLVHRNGDVTCEVDMRADTRSAGAPVTLDMLFQRFKQEMNDYVDRRLSAMENQFAGSAPADRKNTTFLQADAGRYETDMRLAMEAEARRREAEEQRVLEEMVRRQAAQQMREDCERLVGEEKKRAAAEAKRQVMENERGQLMTELRALVRKAPDAEVERTQMKALREKLEKTCDDKLAQMRRDINAMNEVNDSMLEGYGEVKPLIKAATQRMEDMIKKNEHEMFLELNKLRSQVFEAITKRDLVAPVEISNNTPATYMRSPRQIKMSESPALKAGRTAFGAFDLLASPRLGERLKDDAMPADGQRGPPSPLVPRMLLKKCEPNGDWAENQNVRCVMVVSGKRLFFFPKSREGVCDLQFAMVMDLVSLRVWALRVMGSLPLHCCCRFVVVDECVCVFPQSTDGRADLKQAFILTSAEEDRVYSQGCYVELEVPSSCLFHCEVVGKNCLIFCHDEEHNFDLKQTCILDTERLTLRKCGAEFASLPKEILDLRCLFAVVHLKVIIFMLESNRRWCLENTWIVDLNAGMSLQRVETSKSGPALPPASEAIYRVVGDKVYIFPHDNRMCFDFGGVCVLDTGSVRLVPCTCACLQHVCFLQLLLGRAQSEHNFVIVP